MTSTEIYRLIASGNRQKDAQQALFELLALTQELSTATIELAHHVEQLSGSDPLSSRAAFVAERVSGVAAPDGKLMTNNQTQRRNVNDWPRLCEQCETAMTEADSEMGQCSNCGKVLRGSDDDDTN
jgi:hypothetical protein